MKAMHDIRVLVIPSWYPPNGGYFFKEHAQALGNLGIKVDVLAGVYSSLKSLSIFNIHKAFATQFTIEGNFREFIRNCWIIPFSEKANFVVWIKMMQQFINQYITTHGKPDLIIAHSAIWAGFLSSEIQTKHKIPYILVEHRSRFVYNTPEAKAMVKQWYVPYLQKAFSDASSIITVSNSLQSYIQQFIQNPKKKLRSIPNMVDTDFFSYLHNPHSNNPFTFFSLGSLEKIKGMDTLLDAFQLLHKKAPGQFRLIVGGSGTEQKKLKDYVSENNLNNFIQFEGQMERAKVKQRMQQAHAFVLASRFEAFGVVFIEAMACGLPVIATRSGGPEDFLDNQKGILVPPNNPEALANAMQHLATYYHTFDKERIRSYAVSRFSKEAVSRQYFELICQVVNEGS